MDKEEKMLTAILGLPAGVGAVAGLAAYIRCPEVRAIDTLLQSHDFLAPLEYILHGLNAAYVTLASATIGAGVGSYALAFSLGTLYVLNPKNTFTGMPKS